MSKEMRVQQREQSKAEGDSFVCGYSWSIFNYNHQKVGSIYVLHNRTGVRGSVLLVLVRDLEAAF
ncbi:hypothetical protein EXN66_Car011881 [Channa argus]|uniref:Uncharacterized protein n=1 Tax=Channa argus TaxID=215402 RepID=A0A6G1Q108_CHAAH|nr:hypothetical protein EXN66_Car011881 [Channa argus]